jgi:glutathione S-transferase
MTYGGPAVSPDQPSPESVKLAESGVLLEFLADLYPSLLPSDPVGRYRARFAIDIIGTNVIPTYHAFVMRDNQSPKALLEAFEALQKILPEEGFIVGQWSIADAAIMPFIGRCEATLRNDIGKFSQEDGQEAYAALFESPKFARLQKYLKEVQGRDSWKSTWDEVSQHE